ncbi:Regulator of G protein signaling superfamily [Cordyceps militaris CM01]|uniref:Regulator of G protein signaling superfamily n=1 Tax=Cordyceps militaris (strain CM01) TaxID=983644 RepID=G3JPT5_CORMM|nr:Regulator of G protein signaling superfamily [Cordyceps militaris CM01]EGX89186.1 Regulator of G protein signaling superfamily [Cordyceps militaris CM01]
MVKAIPAGDGKAVYWRCGWLACLPRTSVQVSSGQSSNPCTLRQHGVAAARPGSGLARGDQGRRSRNNVGGALKAVGRYISRLKDTTLFLWDPEIPAAQPGATDQGGKEGPGGLRGGTQRKLHQLFFTTPFEYHRLPASAIISNPAWHKHTNTTTHPNSLLSSTLHSNNSVSFRHSHTSIRPDLILSTSVTGILVQTSWSHYSVHPYALVSRAPSVRKSSVSFFPLAVTTYTTLDLALPRSHRGLCCVPKRVAPNSLPWFVAITDMVSLMVDLTPSPTELSPRPSSAFEDFFEIDTCSRPTSELFTSRPGSPRYIMAAHQPPTLREILHDISPPPYTLAAFMAYLSQNHCMETLEFTLDAQRYSNFYQDLASEAESVTTANARLSALWQKLMQVYIVPCAPREVNIPSRVRDRLLMTHYNPVPPHPSVLDDAGRIIYELMNDSLLVPFLESVAPLHIEHGEEQLRSPRSHTTTRSRTSQSLEFEGLTDDSEGNSPATSEPMTPPTTPPTTSDWAFNSSPGGLQRAVAAHNKGWKKMGEKLGFTRKASSRRPNAATSSSSSSGVASRRGSGNSTTL